MADIGTLGMAQIEGKWSARQIGGQVWKAATEKATLIDPRICPTMSMNKLRATIPMMGNLTVESQLEEFEHTVAKGATPSGVDITLYKDRVKLAVSDEAKMDSDVGDPLMIQKSQAAGELAENLDTLIATQIALTPQAQADVDWDSVNPIKTLSTMIGTLRPYQATAVVMAPAAYALYAASISDSVYALGTPADLERGITRVPGFNIPVFASSAFADVSANGVAVIANDVPGVLLGTGGIKARTWDDQDLGATVYQYDIWRTPISNLRQTSGSLNRGVVTCAAT